MSKWKGQYDSGRKYILAWEREFPWLTKAKGGTESAFCKVCQKILQPRKTTIKLHADSKEHKVRVGAVSSVRTNLFERVGPSRIQTPTDSLKKAELQLAVVVCCHSSIATIDHLSEVIKNNSAGSRLENMRLHRTKCSMLISNVISPSLEEDLRKKVNEAEKYCLMVDESTDVSSEKHLCVCVRYYDDDAGDVVTAFLGLVSVCDTSGEALFNATKALLDKNDIDLENCIGYSSDGANNMTGENNSLWSRIKQVSPNCVKMGCSCHSLALCVQKGFDTLPSSLGFMLLEIPKWFRKSTLRREKYKILFETMNTGEERDGTPLPFLSLSTTRWLVRGKVIYNILVNWLELKTYFECASMEGSHDVRYKARILWDMLRDECNYLYFVFSSPIVTEFERVNSLFQSTNATPSRLLYELDTHFKTLRQRIYSAEGQLLPLEKVDFGIKFIMECKRLLRQGNEERVLAVQKRCQNMLIELVDQVKLRLPEKRSLFDGLCKLSPCTILTHLNRPAFSDLPFFHLLEDKLEICEEQYRKILYHPWVDAFKSNLPENPVDFWSFVKRYEVDNHKPYEELSNYALQCLTTPVSNAVLERIFSHVTAVKTKARNRMSLKMLEAILRVRTTLIVSGKCCKDLEITGDMLQKFTVDMYDHARGPIASPEDNDNVIDDLY